MKTTFLLIVLIGALATPILGQTIEFDSPETGSLSGAGDTDWYELATTAAAPYYIEAEVDVGGGDDVVLCFSTSGPSCDRVDGDGATGDFTAKLGSSGTRYVSWIGVRTLSGSSSYTLTVTKGEDIPEMYPGEPFTSTVGNGDWSYWYFDQDEFEEAEYSLILDANQGKADMFIRFGEPPNLQQNDDYSNFTALFTVATLTDEDRTLQLLGPQGRYYVGVIGIKDSPEYELRLTIVESIVNRAFLLWPALVVGIAGCLSPCWAYGNYNKWKVNADERLVKVHAIFPELLEGQDRALARVEKTKKKLDAKKAAAAAKDAENGVADSAATPLTTPAASTETAPKRGARTQAGQRLTSNKKGGSKRQGSGSKRRRSSRGSNRSKGSNRGTTEVAPSDNPEIAAAAEDAGLYASEASTTSLPTEKAEKAPLSGRSLVEVRKEVRKHTAFLLFPPLWIQVSIVFAVLMFGVGIVMLRLFIIPGGVDVSRCGYSIREYDIGALRVQGRYMFYVSNLNSYSFHIQEVALNATYEGQTVATAVYGYDPRPIKAAGSRIFIAPIDLDIGGADIDYIDTIGKFTGPEAPGVDIYLEGYAKLYFPILDHTHHEVVNEFFGGVGAAQGANSGAGNAWGLYGGCVTPGRRKLGDAG